MQVALFDWGLEHDERPYIKFYFKELEAEASAFWEDVDGLRSLEAEAQRRTINTQRRRDFMAKLRNQIELLERTFVWPNSDAVLGDGRLDTRDWPKKGILSWYGYKVGHDCLAEAARHRLLQSILETELAQVNGPEYMASWGTACSMLRLKKLAHSLASLIRNNTRMDATNRELAIQHWNTDLSCLKTKFYDPLQPPPFTWPDTN